MIDWPLAILFVVHFLVTVAGLWFIPIHDDDAGSSIHAMFKGVKL